MKVHLFILLFLCWISIFISGCTAIHRVKISPLDNDIHSIDTTKLNPVFVDNGYTEGSWEYKTIFYPAHVKGQNLVGYWGKTYYGNKNKKRGGTDVWIVTEGQNLVVYVVGDYDILNHTEEFVNDLSVRLLSVYPNANISLRKKYFFDTR